MIDIEKREQKEQEKKKTRQRMQVKVDPNNYEFIPAQKETDYYDNDVNQRVGIYVRVSTDDVRQTTSFELQKKYYEDFVTKHPNWTLVKIYADEGISGTLMDKRDEFKRLLKDCKNRKIDRVLVKSVTRFARNSLECIEAVRELKSYGVSVFFENDKIDTENMNSEMLLYIKSAFAQNESMSLSKRMVQSIRMRMEEGTYKLGIAIWV